MTKMIHVKKHLRKGKVVKAHARKGGKMYDKKSVGPFQKITPEEFNNLKAVPYKAKKKKVVKGHGKFEKSFGKRGNSSRYRTEFDD